MAALPRPHRRQLPFSPHRRQRPGNPEPDLLPCQLRHHRPPNLLLQPRHPSLGAARLLHRARRLGRPLLLPR
ncbi:unnamed protein product [Linum tenue]|uniref:Uncharacterized protein n=1 Tax=Linum tenue TaxID=586396 RepID=A0AAV0P3S9_9ROSI|nr:unnamed protein product [Linum tenue]